jgi:hypothetical protein
MKKRLPATLVLGVLLCAATRTALAAQNDGVWILWIEETKVWPKRQPPVWTVRGSFTGGGRGWEANFDCRKEIGELLYGRDEDMLAYLNLPPSPKPRTLADWNRAVPSLQNTLQRGEARTRGNSELMTFEDSKGRVRRELRVLCLPASVDPRPVAPELGAASVGRPESF